MSEAEERFVDRYRPQKLSDVVGQPKAVSQLTGLVQSGKIAGNTVLISGPYGTGKTTFGRILARTLNCQAGGTDPCGECASCKFSIDNHPDIKEINAADSRGIDDVRSLLEVARLRARYKARVFIMDEAHQLTGAAATAFLKALEEPPKGTAFVLCTTEPYKLPAPIRSRSAWVKLTEIPVRDVSRLLSRVCKTEGIDFPKEVLSYISEMSFGHARDALNMLESLSSSTKSLSLDEAKDQLPAIAEGILGASPDSLVPKYVQKLFDGTIVPMVYVRKVENPEYLLQLLLKFLKEMVIYYIEPKMVDNPALVSFLKSTQFKIKPTPDTLTRLFEIHLEAQERVKSRTIDPLDAIDLAILKSIKVLGA